MRSLSLHLMYPTEIKVEWLHIVSGNCVALWMEFCTTIISFGIRLLRTGDQIHPWRKDINFKMFWCSSYGDKRERILAETKERHSGYGCQAAQLDGADSITVHADYRGVTGMWGSDTDSMMNCRIQGAVEPRWCSTSSLQLPVKTEILSALADVCLRKEMHWMVLVTGNATCVPAWLCDNEHRRNIWTRCREDWRLTAVRTRTAVWVDKNLIMCLHHCQCVSNVGLTVARG